MYICLNPRTNTFSVYFAEAGSFNVLTIVLPISVLYTASTNCPLSNCPYEKFPTFTEDRKKLVALSAVNWIGEEVEIVVKFSFSKDPSENLKFPDNFA